MKISFNVQGMTCAACSARVEKSYQCGPRRGECCRESAEDPQWKCSLPPMPMPPKLQAPLRQP